MSNKEESNDNLTEIESVHDSLNDLLNADNYNKIEIDY